MIEERNASREYCIVETFQLKYNLSPTKKKKKKFYAHEVRLKNVRQLEN